MVSFGEDGPTSNGTLNADCVGRIFPLVLAGLHISVSEVSEQRPAGNTIHKDRNLVFDNY